MAKKHAQTPCIIAVAITGSVPRKGHNPAVPITLNEQLEEYGRSVAGLAWSGLAPPAPPSQRRVQPHPLG